MVMENVLIKTDEYNGRYVAMKCFDDHTVIRTKSFHLN